MFEALSLESLRQLLLRTHEVALEPTGNFALLGRPPAGELLLRLEFVQFVDVEVLPAPFVHRGSGEPLLEVRGSLLHPNKIK